MARTQLDIQMHAISQPRKPAKKSILENNERDHPKKEVVIKTIKCPSNVNPGKEELKKMSPSLSS